MKFKLGCDPELFMADIKGKLRASCGLIGGTKAKPLPLPIGDGFAVQEDNVAIEFNIPPASNAVEFVDSIAKAMDFLNTGVQNMHGFHIVNLSAASFPDDELTSQAAKEFGCDPDYNAWTMEKNPRPSADDPNLRSCGGHVHVGFDKLELDGHELIRMMDFYLGVPATIMDKEGARRRILYGKRGAFREKPYGFEYRTLSNFWVHNKRLSQWVWDNTDRAVNAVKAQFPVRDYDELIYEAIDKNDAKAAEYLVKTFNLEVVSV